MNAPTLIHDLRSAGVVLQADGDRVRFYPRDGLAAEQVEQLRRHKAEVLAVLDGDDEKPSEPPPHAPAPPPEPDAATPAKPPSYTAAERRVLADAGVDPADMPLLQKVKAAFPDAIIESVEPEPVDNPRREAARLIRTARQHDPEHAIALRDTWNERLARCTIDGRLSEARAEQLALAEIAGTQPPADPTTMTPAERERWVRDTAAGGRWHESQCAEIPV